MYSGISNDKLTYLIEKALLGSENIFLLIRIAASSTSWSTSPGGSVQTHQVFGRLLTRESSIHTKAKAAFRTGTRHTHTYMLQYVIKLLLSNYFSFKFSSKKNTSLLQNLSYTDRSFKNVILILIILYYN